MKGEYMKKFIPFKKEIPFKTKIAEITSISIEHNIHGCANNEISGNFIISGEYRVTDTSTSLQEFRLDLPFDIEMSDIYNIDNITIDIDDFYYEIKNMESLEVNITLLIDKIVEVPLLPKEERNVVVKEEDFVKEIDPLEYASEKDSLDNLDRENNDTEGKSEECYEAEDPVDDGKLTREDVVIQNDIPILTEESKNIFSFTEDEDESTYTVYIVRENDTVESIIQKYSISIEKLREYNDLSEFKKGDKIIIPNV